MSARVSKRGAAEEPDKSAGAGPVKPGAAGGAAGLAKKKPPTYYRVGSKLIFTPLSIAELCGTIVLAFLGISIAYGAYKDAVLKYNFEKGLVFTASNQAGNATDRLSRAMQARAMEDWPYPYLLAAKVNVNEGKLEEAEGLYQRLVKVDPGTNAWTKQHKASCQVGLGCIALRRYDASVEGQKPMPKLLDDAASAFKEAGAIDDKCLEAGIGLAQVALRRGWDPVAKKISPDACAIAQKELTNVDKMQLTPTIDGLVDKYMAQGRLAYEREDYSGAMLEFRRAFQLQPTWKSPFANVSFMMAHDFDVSGPSRLDEYEQKQQEFDNFVHRLEALYNADMDRYAVFKDAMYSFFNSIGYVFMKGYRHETGYNYIYRAQAMDADRPTVYINLADVYYFYANSNKFEEQQQIKWANDARGEWQHAAEKCRSANMPVKRMVCLYNRAVILYNKNPEEVSYRTLAADELKQLAREFPANPFILRAQGKIAARDGNISEAHDLLGQAQEAGEKYPWPAEQKTKWKEDLEREQRELQQGKDPNKGK